MKKLFFLVFWISLFVVNPLFGQCDTGVCNGNTGLYSNNDAASIAYDNMGSAFHSTFIREPNGSWRVWGEHLANNGFSNVLSPLSFNATNYPVLTGTIYKMAIGSNFISDVQLVVLTSDGLFVLGDEGAILDFNLTTSTSFQKLTVNGKPDGLPTGVAPDDVKMLFGSTGTLILTTCSGDVYVLSKNTNIRGDGGLGNSLHWSRVMENSSQPLTNVIVARGNTKIGYAIKSDGTLWSWGDHVYLGNGVVPTYKNFATQMTLPPGLTGIKAIQSTFDYSYSNNASYYLLSTDKKVYSLGTNFFGQLGDNTSIDRLSWVNAVNPDNTIIDDAAWISANEHDQNYPGLSLIRTGGILYTAGSNNAYMLGCINLVNNINYLNIPNGISSTDVITYSENGGHTTALIKQGSPRYGYVGHSISGSVGNGLNSSGTLQAFDFITPPIIAVCGTPCIPPVLTVSNNSVCIGQDAVFTITGTAGDIVSYKINNGNPETIVIGTDGTATVTITDPTTDQTIDLFFLLGATGTCSNNLSISATITVGGNIMPLFTQVPSICEGQTLDPLPATSNNGVAGIWSPALNNMQTTTYTFTPSNNGPCLASTASMTIVVSPGGTVPTFSLPISICEGEVLLPLPGTSNEQITGSWSPAVDNTTTTTYTFTPNATGCVSSIQATININQPVVPTFTQVAPICEGASIDPLPTVSNNDIPGTWSPAINNTATTTYTFTSSTANSCVTNAMMEIIVNQKINPVFNPIAPICAGDLVSPLPLVSNNNFTGTWSPAFNNMATTTYTFTPDPGMCCNPKQVTVEVNQPVTPTFTQIAAICEGASIAPLSTVSNNNISGTWSPAINNTATTTYTFTPSAASLCATSTTMEIVVNQKIDPVFNPIAPICAGDSVSPLPLVSNNNFTGTWSPSFNNLATTTYTFTPDPGMCCNPKQVTVVVNQPVTPTFIQIAPICEGASIDPLPTVSNNNISGTWSPQINNMATTTYTFTPTLGYCQLPTTMTITVNPLGTAPTFTPIPGICQGDALVPLPTSSLEGVTGAWSPALNNMHTTTYTFAPLASGCLNNAQLTVSVSPKATPVFTLPESICFGQSANPLVSVSNNQIIGSWAPAFNNAQTTTYTFTPATGICANEVTATIIVNPAVMPKFMPVLPICEGAALSALPLASLNGYEGTWSPPVNNMVTTSYTFTPFTGLCASLATMSITVNPKITPVFSSVGPLCFGDQQFTLPTVSQNGISGTWSPVINSTESTTYTYTPNSGECATNSTMKIDVYDDFDFDYKGYCDNNDFYLQVFPRDQSFDSDTASYIWQINGQTVTNTAIFDVTSYLESTEFMEAFPLHFAIKVIDANGCEKQRLISVDNAFCGIQKGISVNDDDLNDFFDLRLLDVRHLNIFNRYGMKVYSKARYKDEWKGQSDHGDELPVGVYYYVIDFNNDTSKTGWIYLERK